MSEPTQTETLRKPFQNLEGSNAKQKEIARLRSLAFDEGESPTERLVAAAKLLSRFGPTRRNQTVIREVIQLFVDSADYSIAERAAKLKKKFMDAKGLKEVAESELPETPEPTTAPAPQESSTVADTSADNTVLLHVTSDELIAVHDAALSRVRWVGFNEGRFDLSSEDRMNLLKQVLGDRTVTVENVKALHTALRAKNAQGWSLTKFPAFRIAEEFLKAQGVAPEEEKKEPDGFQRGLIDPEAAVARVVAAGYDALPKGCSDTNILRVALGDVPLDDKSVAQLWLTLGYWFKEVLGGGPKEGSKIMPAPARWIIACICGYANPRHIEIRDPNIFTFSDAVAFRS
jgi:hypothetical protein